MADTKSVVTVAAAPRAGRPSKKRGPGRPKGSGVKRGPGRPPKAAAAAEAVVKRGPGRPKGSGAKRGPGRPPKAAAAAEAVVKRGPGRPKGSSVKRGPGRPKGPGRPAAVKAGVSPRQVKRIVKAAVKAYQAQLPKLINKELRRLLR